MTKKTRIIIGSIVVVIIALVAVIVSYLNSPGYYFSRELHWQREKQEALNALKEADMMIKKYREKRNAIQHQGIDYLNVQKDFNDLGE